MKNKGSYDYYLILATTIVLFAISLLCIYGMFYFKLAMIHQMAPADKLAYMDRMNTIISPFLIALVLFLGICVPKRLLPTTWLNRFAVALVLCSIFVSIGWGIRSGLILVLFASLFLQVLVLALALAGSKILHFERKGYLVRLGSSLLHLGLILFILDLFFWRMPVLHLALFWITTVTTVLGMTFCFYAESVARLVRHRKNDQALQHDR